MSAKWLIAAGLFGLAVGLLARLPAPIAAGWLESALPALSVSGVSGSVWEGRAARALYRDIPLLDVQWSLAPWALLTGSVAATVSTATDAGRLQATVSRGLDGALVVTDAYGVASLAWLARRAGYTFVPISGQIRLALERAVIAPDGNVQALAGQLTARALHWDLLKPSPLLGTFTAALTGEAGALRAQIVASEGPIALDGSAALSPAGVYRLDLRLRARENADPRLVELLTELGQADPEGWYRIAEQGRL